MNLRNRLEMSVVAFFGTSCAILLGVAALAYALFRHTRKKQIL
jgi:hypothetical protein